MTLMLCNVSRMLQLDAAGGFGLAARRARDKPLLRKQIELR